MGNDRDLNRTRRQLMKAALTEFAAKGFAGARTDAIARRAGVDERMIYYCFETKEGLYREVLRNKLAQEVLSDLEVRIQQTGGQVDVGELPGIDADPLQMRQLFQNLVVNALKFHQEGKPPLIRVRGQILNPPWEESAGNGHTEELCRITVEDNGIGFDEKYLDRIFILFQRLHGRSAYEGTGIGLAICRKIADRHGGTITAKSMPGEGFTFIVSLPLKQPLRAVA